jgi:hypothetical protein
MTLPNKPRVLAATYNPVSKTKMISFLVDFPTVLLAELRTHRIITQGSLYEHMELDDFNMSANSARAIPHTKYLEKVLDNPFIPIWTKQQKGMSGEFLKNNEYSDNVWLKILGYLQKIGLDENYRITDAYNDLIKLGVHKQNANRLLAPYAWTTCILTGTELENFFELRCPKYYYAEYSENGDDELLSKHFFKSKKEYLDYFTNEGYTLDKVYIRDLTGNKRPKKLLSEFTEEDWQSINTSSAQPEFQVIAEILYDLYQGAEWKENEYHIPFEEDIEKLYKKTLVEMCGGLYGKLKGYDTEKYYDLLMKISASMCAKLSYNTQDNIDTLEKHLERSNILIESKHQEPFSHQAVAMDYEEYRVFKKTMLKGKDKKYVEEYGKCYNLTGFIPQRYILENY